MQLRVGSRENSTGGDFSAETVSDSEVQLRNSGGDDKPEETVRATSPSNKPVPLKEGSWTRYIRNRFIKSLTHNRASKSFSSKVKRASLSLRKKRMSEIDLHGPQLQEKDTKDKEDRYVRLYLCNDLTFAQERETHKCFSDWQNR